MSGAERPGATEYERTKGSGARGLMRTPHEPQLGGLGSGITGGARVHTGCSWLRLVSRMI
jgi:hypothetical protein